MKPDELPTIFSKLRRYSRTPGRNPREDRLTESLAVTLEAAPKAAAFLIERLFHLKVPSIQEQRIQTQLPTKSGRVDLAVSFGSRQHPDVVVWFENKVDARADASQGEKYLHERDDNCAKFAFAWVLQVGERVHGDLPEEAQVLSWQDVGQALEEWRQTVPSVRNSPNLDVFMVGQFVRHLEIEEKLAMTTPFTRGDAQALQRTQYATERLDRLMDAAASTAWERWGKPEDANWRYERGRDATWYRFYLFRERHPELPLSKWYLEFALTDDVDRREKAIGQQVLSAGLALEFPDRALGPVDEVFDRLKGRRFEIGHVGPGPPRGWDCCCQYMDLSELADSLDGQDFGEQTKSLADWIIRSFETVREALSAAE